MIGEMGKEGVGGYWGNGYEGDKGGTGVGKGVWNEGQIISYTTMVICTQENTQRCFKKV